jgi:hypothetical protein
VGGRRSELKLAVERVEVEQPVQLVEVERAVPGAGRELTHHPSPPGMNVRTTTTPRARMIADVGARSVAERSVPVPVPTVKRTVIVSRAARRSEGTGGRIHDAVPSAPAIVTVTRAAS